MRFTVVTPALNGMAYLPGCVESVRSQEADGIEVEHIVVDGGSTDGTPDYAEANGCVVMGREKPGVTFAINKGIAHAKGELVSMLGCDDRLLPGGLTKVARAYQATDRRWVVSACRWLDPAGRPRGVQPAAPSWLTAPSLATLGWSCIPHVAAFIQRDLHDELGGLDERFTYAPDYEFFCRALAAGRPFARLAAPAVAMVRHGDNLSMQRTPDHLAELHDIEARYASRNPAARTAARYLLKVWINGSSPTWFACKKLDRLRERPAG
jgi:glycosyltransferase involved in cell wall biosynthesis